MNLLSNIQNFLSTSTNSVCSLATSINANIPSPINEVVSKVASVVLNKYTLLLGSTFLVMKAVKRHTNFSLKTKDSNNEDKQATRFKTLAEHKNTKINSKGFKLAELATVVTLVATAIAFIK